MSTAEDIILSFVLSVNKVDYIAFYMYRDDSLATFSSSTIGYMNDKVECDLICQIFGGYTTAAIDLTTHMERTSSSPTKY